MRDMTYIVLKAPLNSNQSTDYIFYKLCYVIMLIITFYGRVHTYLFTVSFIWSLVSS